MQLHLVSTVAHTDSAPLNAIDNINKVREIRLYTATSCTNTEQSKISISKSVIYYVQI